MFEALAPIAPDPLLKLIPLFQADARPDKIDLGVGVYRDDEGRTPVFAAVKAAEQRLLSDQPTKAYLGAQGDVEFTRALGELAFAGAPDRTRVGLQTPGGTAALRVGAELIRRARPQATVWLSIPTWPNHEPIFRALGMTVATYDYFDGAAQAVAFEAMTAALEKAQAGDVVLVQACCHNPTGADPSPDQWRALADQMARKGLIPFVDLAYLGLGRGVVEDVEGLGALLARCDEAIVAVSGSKSFGLYRERVGALYATAESASARAAVETHLASIARGLYSMPPDHGAAVVRMILRDPVLRESWRAELEAARQRIVRMRQAFGARDRAGLALGAMRDQMGMFSTLPLSDAQIARLRTEHGVYMTDAGRINLAGINEAQCARVLDALDAVVT